MNEEYFSLVEAAEYVGVSRVKLSQLVKKGVIPFETSPLDKRVKWFKRSDLDMLRGPHRVRRKRTE